MKAKHIFISTILISLLNSCMIDKAYDNMTIKNNSQNYLTSTFLADTLKGEKWVYYIIRSGNIEYLKKNCFIIEPKGEEVLSSFINMKKRVDKDTVNIYIYIVDISLIDSLKRNSIDSVTIKNKAVKRIKTTYAGLEKMNWIVTYP